MPRPDLAVKEFGECRHLDRTNSRTLSISRSLMEVFITAGIHLSPSASSSFFFSSACPVLLLRTGGGGGRKSR